MQFVLPKVQYWLEIPDEMSHKGTTSVFSGLHAEEYSWIKPFKTIKDVI